MKLIFKLCALGSIVMSILSCKKFVEVQPPATKLIGTSVYSTNPTAAAAVTAIYLSMGGSNGDGMSVGGNTNGISALLGLSADEFTLYPNSGTLLNQAYTNTLLSINPAPEWVDLYNCIYQANAAIQGISASTGVTTSMKQQLTGEAKFIRAFCNFYLVNIYGDVPLVTSTDYKVNALIARSPQAEIYQQIVDDLKNAQSLLSDNFLAPDGTTTFERVRPNKGAATAFLARVYLFERKWDSAEAEATTVINNTNYSLLNNLNDVFLANSNEAIWQLEMPDNGFNTPDGGAFLLSYYGGPNSYAAQFILSDSLVNNFESGDRRFSNWVDSIVVTPNTYYFPFKYKLNYTGAPPAEYPMILRLAEQYLIRAEARAQQDNLNGSEADLNIIRARAGLPNTSASTQENLLSAIYHERRFELFTEYGHRWLDLKRTGNLDGVMNIATPLKGGMWRPSAQLFPIPLTEIQRDGNLTQNPGYN